jgi:hypothetical protein
MDAPSAQVRAEEFVAVGENGVERVILQSGPGIHASMRLLDADGKRVAALTVGGGQGERPGYVGINVFNDEGVNVLRVGTMDRFSGTNVLLNDNQGRTRLRLEVAADGTPSIELLDAKGQVTWRAG